MKSFYCCRIELDDEKCYLKFPPNINFDQVKQLLRVTESGKPLVDQLRGIFHGYGFEVHITLPDGGEVDYVQRFLSSF